MMGLRGKIVLAVSGLVVTSLLIASGFIYWQNMQLIRQHSLALAQDDLEKAAVGMRSKLYAAEESLLTLRGIPPVEAIMRARAAGGIDPESGDSVEVWRQRMQQIFSAFLSHGGRFEKLRYFDENGMEMVRVDAVNGVIRVIPQQALQNKASCNYFQQAIKMSANSVYIGEMILSREHGRITLPQRAVIHLAVPVYDDKQQLRGLLVANVLADYLLKSLPAEHDGIKNYLFDEQGHYLLHPIMEKRFAHELGRDDAEEESVYGLLSALGSEQRYVAVEQRSDGTRELQLFEKIYYAAPRDHHHRYWVLLRTMPEQLLYSELEGTGNSILLLGLLITGLCLVVVAWVATRKIVRPIGQLVEASERLQQGDLSVRLPVHEVRDEFKTLYGMVNAFAEKQQQTTAQLAREVKDRTARLSNIMESMADGLITIDHHGIIQSFNRAAEHIFGYSASEVIGKNVKILMPESFRSQHDDYIQRATETERLGVLHRQLVGLRRDGSTFPIDLSISEVRSDEQHSFVGIVRDISELTQAAEEIAAKNADLIKHAHYEKSYAACMSVLSSTHDKAEAMHDILSVLAEHHDFPVSAIYLHEAQQGRLICAASHGAPDHMQTEIMMGEGLVGQAAKAQQILEIDGQAEQGGLLIEAGILSFMPVAVMACPILFQRSLIGVLVLAASAPMNELDRKLIAQFVTQMGIAFNNFEQYDVLKQQAIQLQQQRDEIQSKNRELESASRMKSEFLANMSHELRTPLNAIIGFSELIKDGAVGELNHDQRDYLKEIFDSGQHLLELINEILDLSKIEAGKMELELNAVIISDMLENSLSIISEKAMKHGVSVHTDIDAGLGSCIVDIRKLKQILYNLLSNAVKFTPKGGSVTLSACLVPSTDLVEGADKPYLEISVIDTGIGIAKEDQERIFFPFEQADGSLTRRYEGTGLGLILVKSMVELHGGNVRVESNPGQGSTFTISIPYRQAICADEPENVNENVNQVNREYGARGLVTAGDQLCALIIEDDHSSAELMRRKLEKYGFLAERAATAEGAIFWLRNHQADLIVLDIMLPLTNGWQFLEALKKHQNGINVPVLVVSAVAQDNYQKGMALGASAMLQKPVSDQALNDVLLKLGFVGNNTAQFE
ncbi:PAS domain S-box protein [Ghiorsea bivora]|uniref:PAS domain S-box protein n=1 Tax=Ghiorsea bivora TaxID=1485545 RepID=UPI00056F56BE|nr:PAS domain S-box protein [Ghiorsea bivora]